jgi:nucleotide-binding universal stress UspA family protein
MPQFTEMRRPTLWVDQAPVASPVGGRTVVVGYDGSDASRRALVRAAEAAGDGGRILVITSVAPSDSAALEHETALEREPARLLQEAAALLRGPDVDVTTRIAEGDAAEALAVAAYEAGADLIVVGARGRSYLARALRGSVAERLVTRAPCSLLVAR